MPDIFAFLSFVFIATFTPGPNNILSMLNAGKHGLRKAIKFNIGVFIGFTIVMVLCGILGSILVDYLPMIKPFLKYVGAAYILWLAYKIIKSNYSDINEENNNIYGVKEGFTLQFVNPKVIIYGITTLSTFIVPYYGKFTTVAFSIGLASVAFVATLSWAIFGTAFHKLLKKHTKAFNIVMALLLVYTAISLVI